MSVMEDVTTVPVNTDGDHDRFAHIVEGKKGELLRAMVMGTEVVALCGTRWIPAGRNTFPVCPTCKEIFERRTRRPVSDCKFFA